MTKAQRQFIKTRDAFAKVEKAVLDLMPRVYASDRLMDEVARRKDWIRTTLRHAAMVLEVQYERARGLAGPHPAKEDK